MSLETQVAVIEQNVDSTRLVVDRLNNAIEKITAVTADIGKILAVHDQRIERGEKATHDVLDLLERRRQEMNEDIKELHSRITTTTRELSAEIGEVQKCVMSGIEDLKKELKEDQLIHSNRQKDLEERIVTLERWRYILVGAGIVGGFVLTKLINALEFTVK